MNIILHGPATKKDEKELAKRVAEIHAECILRFLESLDCPPGQKKQILERIIKQHQDITHPPEP